MPKIPPRSRIEPTTHHSSPKMVLGKPRPQPPAPVHPALQPVAWSSKQIRVVLSGSGMTVSILAAVAPPLAVHRTLAEGVARGDAPWSVTHLPTGTLITAVTREADAYRIAETLLREVGGALNDQSATRVRSRLPKWVEPWVLECRVKKVYLDPTPYVGAVDAKDS